MLSGFSAGGRSLSAKHLLKNSKKLIILKAFTKLYGMAGVRLGYCLCSDTELLARMRAAGQPWAVSSLAQAAGIAALDETEYVAKVRALIEAQRPVLADGLRALGLRVIEAGLTICCSARRKRWAKRCAARVRYCAAAAIIRP